MKKAACLVFLFFIAVLSRGFPDACAEAPLIVPGLGIKEVRLGMTVSEIIAALGRPDDLYDSEEEDVYYSYYAKGISVLFRPEGSLLRAATIYLYSGVEGGYEKPIFRKYRGLTDRSISLDSTYGKVIKAYGAPETKGELLHIPVPSVWMAYDSKGLGFSFRKDDGRMIYLYVMKPVRKEKSPSTVTLDDSSHLCGFPAVTSRRSPSPPPAPSLLRLRVSLLQASFFPARSASG